MSLFHCTQDLQQYITTMMEGCVESELDLIRRVPIDASPASVMHRSRYIGSLQNLVKPGGHGLRSHMAVHNLGSTLIPLLVLGEQYQATLALGLQKASTLIPVLFSKFCHTLQDVYDKVGL